MAASNLFSRTSLTFLLLEVIFSSSGNNFHHLTSGARCNSGWTFENTHLMRLLCNQRTEIPFEGSKKYAKSWQPSRSKGCGILSHSKRGKSRVDRAIQLSGALAGGFRYGCVKMHPLKSDLDALIPWTSIRPNAASHISR